MAAGKNTHLEHIEDEIINKGATGGYEAIKMLRKMGEFLSGSPGPSPLVTTKFDGAPAIVCGIDPSDNQFFVGTKSVFAITDPKICKTQEDVQRMYNGALANKLSDCLRYLPSADIKGVLQGDLMFTDDKKTEIIKGQSYISFRPNTITYAVEPGTPLGRTISNARIGIVFHTKYTGPSLAEMKASFDISNGDFNSGGQVWAQKAEFQDISGAASMSRPEKLAYDAAVNRAEGSLKQAGNVLNKIQSGKKTLQIDTEFKKFFNGYIKTGQGIPPVQQAYNEFYYHLGREYDKAILKNKTLNAQATKAGKFMEAVDFLQKNERQIKMVIASYLNIIAAKNILVDKMNRVGGLKLFVDMGNGDYRVTNPEGFVAVQDTGAVKLIDRLEFSKLNFTVEKNW
jgi:hypothetical protein